MTGEFSALTAKYNALVDKYNSTYMRPAEAFKKAFNGSSSGEFDEHSFVVNTPTNKKEILKRTPNPTSSQKKIIEEGKSEEERLLVQD